MKSAETGLLALPVVTHIKYAADVGIRQSTACRTHLSTCHDLLATLKAVLGGQNVQFLECHEAGNALPLLNAHRQNINNHCAGPSPKLTLLHVRTAQHRQAYIFL